MLNGTVYTLFVLQQNEDFFNTVYNNISFSLNHKQQHTSIDTQTKFHEDVQKYFQMVN